MVLVLLGTDRYNPTLTQCWELPFHLALTVLNPSVSVVSLVAAFLFVSVFHLMKGISYCWTELNNHTRMPEHRNPISTKEWKEKWHGGIGRIWNPEIKGNKASLENNREEPTLSVKIYVHFEIDLCNFQALLLVEENPQTFGSKHFFIHI